jgi:hypothetical protein
VFFLSPTARRGLPKTFPLLTDDPVFVVLNGLEGPATIKGEHYQGVMPPFDHPDPALLLFLQQKPRRWRGSLTTAAWYRD